MATLRLGIDARDARRGAQQFTTATDRVSRGGKQAADATQRVESSFERLRRQAFSLRGALAGLGIAVLARQMTQFGTNAVRALDNVGKAAGRVGQTTDSLQELRFAAEQSGVNVNTLDMALQRFSRRVGEAVSGSGELADTLEQYNIQLTDAEGRTRSNRDILEDLADKMSDAGSEQERLRIAFKAFDSEGAALINLMRNGSEAIQEYAASARRLGLVIDEELIQDAEDLSDQMSILNQVFQTNIQKGFVRQLTGDMEDLSDVVSAPELAAGMEAIGSAIGFVSQQALASAAILGNYIDAIEKLGTLDFSGAAEAFNRAGSVVINNRTPFNVGNDTGFPDPMGDLRDAFNRRMGELHQGSGRIPGSGDGDGESDAEKAIRRVRENISDAIFEIGVLQSDMGEAEIELTRRLRSALPEQELLGAIPDEMRGQLERVLERQIELERSQERMNELREDGRAVTDQFMTAQDAFNASLMRYNTLRSEGVISEGTFQRAMDETRQELLEQNEAYRVLMQSGERAFDRIGGAVTTMFAEGEDAALNWQGVINGVLSEVMQTMMQLAAINPLKNALFGTDSATIGDMGGLIGGLFGGSTPPVNTANPLGGGNFLPMPATPRAEGGPISAGKPYLVGERGPEIVVPKMPGTVVPNMPSAAMGGGMGAPQVVNNVEVINNSGQQVNTEERRNSSGGFDLRVEVGKMVASEMSRFGSEPNKVIRKQLGGRNRVTQRG